jgi:hypothetical protein
MKLIPHRILFILCAATLLFTASCELLGLSQSGQSRVELPDVVIGEGETVNLEEYGAALTFVRKISENRCPKEAECFLAGAARILVVFTPSRSRAVSLELSIPDNVDASSESNHPPVDTLGYRLLLVELTPYPDVENPQPEEDVTATLLIEPLSPKSNMR